MNELLTGEELLLLDSAASLEEVAQVAVSLLEKLRAQNGHQIVEICGPMSTGGLGSFEANMARFKLAVEMAGKNGYVVFDLPLFQPAIVRVTGFKEGEEGYCYEILEIFIRRVFESGHIGKAFFLPGWETSIGSRWEREELGKLGIPIEDYPIEWFNGHV